MFQIKQDGYKLLFLNRKPVPMEVKSIGVWEHIYAGFVNLSAITNVGIICFTSDLLNDWSVLARLSTFVFGVLFTYLILHFVHKGLPPESEAVSVQLKRQQVYVDRVINGVEGEEAFHEAETEEDDTTHHLFSEVHNNYA
jgi:hypothetical protein